MKQLIIIFAVFLLIPQLALATCADCKSIQEASDNLDLKKDDASQSKQLQTTFTLLEKLSRTYGGKNPYTLPTDEMKPLVSLIVKTLKIDPSQYAVEAAYPLIKGHQAAFEQVVEGLTEKERKLLRGALHDYQDVIKNGN